MRTRSNHKRYAIEAAAKNMAATDQAIADYKSKKITVNELYRRGTFERAGYWFDLSHTFTVLMDGSHSSGKLVRILGNWEYITNAPYFNYTFVNPYRVVYFTGDGKRVAVDLSGERWTNYHYEKHMPELFHLEFISIIREDGSRYLN